MLSTALGYCYFQTLQNCTAASRLCPASWRHSARNGDQRRKRVAALGSGGNEVFPTSLRVDSQERIEKLHTCRA
ncbi:hypothetical protein RB213_008544 [Colletotrichum asianum]